MPFRPLAAAFSGRLSWVGGACSSFPRRLFSSERLVDVHVAQGSGHVATITLNRPRAKNALSRDLMQQLREAVDTFGTPEQAATAGARRVRVILLRSAVPGAFCAGADLKERNAMTGDEARNYVKWLRSSMLALERLPQTTIACVNGAAFGGGLELAVSCDFRVSSTGATVGLPETSLGIIPGAGGTQRLPRLIGLQKAKFLTLTARRLTADEALDYGILDFVEGANEEKLVPTALGNDPQGKKTMAELTLQKIATTAESLASKLFSQQSCPKGMEISAQRMDAADRLGLYLCDQLLQVGPVALRAAKKAMYEGMQQPNVEQSMSDEAAAYEMVLPTRDRLEAMKAFAEKRKPEFEGW